MDKCKMNKLLDFWLFYNLTKIKKTTTKTALSYLAIKKQKENLQMQVLVNTSGVLDNLK